MSSKLVAFESWLLRRGREVETAKRYRRILARALAQKDGPESILLRRSDSALYRRLLYAALSSWATFTEDTGLILRMKEIRLPPAEPVAPREPFAQEDWAAILSHIETDPDLSEPLRHTLHLIALRGIRCGDTVRIRRAELDAAVRGGVLRFAGKRGRRLEYQTKHLKKPIEGLLSCPWRGATYVRDLISPGADSDTRQESACRAVRRAFDRVARELGIDPSEIHSHRFRHTYATRFLQEMSGNPEAGEMLDLQMGWTNPNTKRFYLRRNRRPELEEVETRLIGKLGR